MPKQGDGVQGCGKKGFNGLPPAGYDVACRVTNPAERLFTEAECPTGPIESLPEDPPEAVDCPNKEELRAKAEEKCPRGRFYDDCVEDVLTTCDLDEWVDDATDAEDDFDEIDERDITVPEDGGEAPETPAPPCPPPPRCTPL